MWLEQKKSLLGKISTTRPSFRRSKWMGINRRYSCFIRGPLTAWYQHPSESPSRSPIGCIEMENGAAPLDTVKPSWKLRTLKFIVKFTSQLKNITKLQYNWVIMSWRERIKSVLKGANKRVMTSKRGNKNFYKGTFFDHVCFVNITRFPLGISLSNFLLELFS